MAHHFEDTDTWNSLHCLGVPITLAGIEMQFKD